MPTILDAMRVIDSARCPQKTIIELYILPIKYETPPRDALAKRA